MAEKTIAKVQYYDYTRKENWSWSTKMAASGGKIW